MKAPTGRERKTLWRQVDNTTMNTVMGRPLGALASSRWVSPANAGPVLKAAVHLRRELRVGDSSCIYTCGHSTQEGESSIRTPSCYCLPGVQPSLVRAHSWGGVPQGRSVHAPERF